MPLSDRDQRASRTVVIIIRIARLTGHFVGPRAVALVQDRPVMLFRLACERLHEPGLVRPGLTVIGQSLVGAARREAARRETATRVAGWPGYARLSGVGCWMACRGSILIWGRRGRRPASRTAGRPPSLGH